MENEEVKAPEPDNSHPSEQESPAVPADETGALDQSESAPEDSKEQDQQQAGEQVPAENGGRDQTALVCYGRMNLLGEFRRPSKETMLIGTKVVVQTERGIEIGKIVLGYCEGCGDRNVSRQKWQPYVGQDSQTYDISRQGRIDRQASEQDLIDQEHLNRNAAGKLELCQKLIEEMKLEMKLVDVEHLFGGDRILFYFKSEKRVDFRKLVRKLAKEYQTRIEMRQVGARDEAKLLADYERCGRQCCCRSFLKHLAPVNMRMAKVQKATLDPAKISGRCGRLMCCLRYEQGTYDKLRKALPPRNTLVETPSGEGLVVDRQILTQLVMVRLANAKRVAFPLAEIEVVPNKPKQSAKEKSPDKAESQQQERSDSNAQSGGSKRRRRGKRGRQDRAQN